MAWSTIIKTALTLAGVGAVAAKEVSGAIKQNKINKAKSKHTKSYGSGVVINVR